MLCSMAQRYVLLFEKKREKMFDSSNLILRGSPSTKMYLIPLTRNTFFLEKRKHDEK